MLPDRQITSLVITGRPPWPVDDGWKMRTYNILKGMVADGIDVELATFVDPAEPLETTGALQEICTTVYTSCRNKAYRYRDLLKGIGGRIPFSVHNYDVPSMHEVIARLGRDHSYDLVMVEDVVMAPYVKQFPAAVKFLDMHNIESHLMLRYAEQERRFARKRYALMTGRKLARFEEQAAGWFDGIFVCSDNDKQLLEQMSVHTRIEVMPNGIDPGLYSCINSEPQDGSIVFVGSMDYHANISGVIWFVTQVLPLVLAEKPDLKFYIVGKNPPGEVLKMASASVIVTGAVPDVRPYLVRATVVVVPLLVGGGTRLKILEAMAVGKAVVSTSLGCEGLRVSHCETIMLADSPKEFARSILLLDRDQALSQKIGLRGKMLVEAEYDWQSITARIRTMYEQRVIDHA